MSKGVGVCFDQLSVMEILQLSQSSSKPPCYRPYVKEKPENDDSNSWVVPTTLLGYIKYNVNILDNNKTSRHIIYRRKRVCPDPWNDSTSDRP